MDYHENGPVNKRSKFSSSSSMYSDQFSFSSSQVNMVAEPKTLGLRLRKSPSLVDLIETKLFRDNVDAAAAAKPIQYQKSIINRGGYSGSKKASNFHAFHLRIGSWEYVSRFAGDLVAKYYFSKNKLSWELLYGGLKSKIEISWSDILDLQYHCPETGPGFLSIVLARKPLFYIESNPEPKKHTIWQLTEDFTDGQASFHRQHFLQCSVAVLRTHVDFFNYLRRIRPSVVIHSLLFESERSPSTEESSSSFRIDEKRDEDEEEDCVKEVVPDWDMLKKKGEHRSISYTDFVMNTPQMNTEENDEFKNTLENISAILMSDTQPLIATSDEKTLMSRINSFWSLL